MQHCQFVSKMRLLTMSKPAFRIYNNQWPQHFSIQRILLFDWDAAWERENAKYEKSENGTGSK